MCLVKIRGHLEEMKRGRVRDMRFAKKVKSYKLKTKNNNSHQNGPQSEREQRMTVAKKKAFAFA